MIAHVPDTDRDVDTATEIAVPRPRSGEPRVAPRPPSDGAHDPFLVAAQMESSAALLTWVVRFALLVAVGHVVLVAAL
ncbi:MAG TPA: hypothetical protein VK935_22520 [Actinomycetospora sp.]|nr:hypothetical protein [Actinomycetospora sp.]